MLVILSPLPLIVLHEVLHKTHAVASTGELALICFEYIKYCAVFERQMPASLFGPIAMTDVHSAEIRSKNMMAIKSKNSQPELIVRRLLHAKGFRYRLHNKLLPGKPDLIFKKYNAVLFVHGCFWHMHDCPNFKLPKTRTEFWLNKLNKNRVRDARQIRELSELGWRIAVVWECALRGRHSLGRDEVAARLEAWLKSDSEKIRIRGYS